MLYLEKGLLVGPIGRDVFVFHISHLSRPHTHTLKSQMKVTGCLTALIFNAIISLVFFFSAAAVAVVIAPLLCFVSLRAFS